MQFLEQRRLALRRAHFAVLDSEMFEYLIKRRIADVIDQLQGAKARERVRRLHDDAQERERILDVRRLREPDAAKLAKRNARAPELDFQIKRVRARAKQHGD